MKTLRLILGDQLNIQHSWFKEKDEAITYCLFEMKQETGYVTHHIQKIVAFFDAMRNFSKKLQNERYNVIYYTLDHQDNQQDLTKNLRSLIDDQHFEKFEYQLPDEYRLDQQLKDFCEQLDIPSETYDTEHFYTSRSEFKAFFEGNKQYLMERFYRHMRQKHKILLDDKGEPEGGEWNYDKENRKKIPKNHVPVHPKTWSKDVAAIVKMIQDQKVETIGTINENDFIWPTTRKEGLELLHFFTKECLANFGDFQDAMTPEFWSLYHSRLSFVLNAKLIHPREVIENTLATWWENSDKVKIAAVEGFVRQILGWREYMRGVYWAHMPDYATLNFFNHKIPLPDWFWTGKTKMKCLQHAIGQSLHYAYAHHIQRLMVTGNFALLAGIDPDEVDKWYLGIYIDAIEWVEITNTRGMSQFADGGIVGSKPYVASANYMHKMSHYCSNCHYNYKEKTGDKACPFNSMYWNFMDKNRNQLEHNPRIGMVYRTWDKMDGKTKADYIEQAEKYISDLNNL
ncbi:MAG: cryptochrome/photolyase family protein [Saprospiraceae bacterium]|nr:cryptochrome/photolyase family protein [Saprospiraceae bacterium]